MDFSVKRMMPNPYPAPSSFQNNTKPDNLILKSYFEEEQGKAFFLHSEFF